MSRVLLVDGVGRKREMEVNGNGLPTTIVVPILHRWQVERARITRRSVDEYPPLRRVVFERTDEEAPLISETGVATMPVYRQVLT